ncbi:hypothetical protein B0T16DRAFT_322059 [Cercophora newfieldiana]|uniref:Zn(2)-C6 fungal-type domain-containing protein n=1 Tax=Cercophora newfieldiana TaxID=92897 RepID=A0AA39YHI6_9PEZI|nr:hypothetical protein B0T16DRAFT_322059 [Cercophora newfieldiana]
MLKATARRSACDQCRAKRVQCIRTPGSTTAPCARCSHIGALCVTGAPGHPGRPRKHRPRQVDNDGDSTPSSSPASGIVAVSGYAVSRSVEHSTRDSQLDLDPLLHDQSQPGPGSAPPDLDQSPGPDQENILALVDHQLQLSTSLQSRDSTAWPDAQTCIDPLLLDLWEDILPPPNPPPLVSTRSGAASALVRFREEVDQRIAAVDAYYSDPFKVIQGCKEEMAEGAPAPEAENPAALLLTTTNEFIDIIRGLTGLTINTELVLLVLSSYLSLMRLYDNMFHCIYHCICQMPSDALKSVRVKSVLRVGGISTLQDMSLKTYATGILDAVQAQVRTLEQCMGVPTEYCLSSEAKATSGMFFQADRAQLFHTVMAQEDVKPRRGSKSYVESIRVSIQDSVGFLEWMASS